MIEGIGDIAGGENDFLTKIQPFKNISGKKNNKKIKIKTSQGLLGGNEQLWCYPFICSNKCLEL